MKISVFIAAICALVCSTLHADQGLQDNLDCSNFNVYDAGFFSANNLTSGGATYSNPLTGEIVNGPLAWWSQASWFVDPQNSSGHASDSNSGLTNTSPLLTWAELSRRLWGATASGFVTITAMSDGNSSDSVVMNVMVPLSVASYGYFVTAPLNAIYSGTVTTYTAASSGPAADDNEITDYSIPTSFTASGLLADGLLARTTSGPLRYFMIAKDLGSKTARISVPVTSAGAASSLTNGQTYEVDQLVKIYGLEWPGLTAQSSSNSGVYLEYKFIADESPGLAWQPASFQHCWRMTASDTDTAFDMSDIGIAAGVTTNFRSSSKQFLAFNFGLVRSSILVETGAAIIGGTVFEGAQIQLQRGTTMVATSRFDVDDTSTSMLLALTGSTAVFSGSGNLSGSGNSGNIISVSGGGKVIYDNTPVAASSTSGTNISVNGTAYAVSNLPVSDPNSLGGVRQATAPSYSSGCAQFNTSGILSSTGVACGTGSGTVTSVSGTAGRISVSPSSPNPVVDLSTFGTALTCAWANVVTDAWGRTTCTSNSAPQPAGNYITALTHDVAATGPGSVTAEVIGITDGTSIDHPVAASAWTNGQALALDGSGDIHTAPFQAPLTACTDYVSVSCQGGTSDIGTGGSNSSVQAIALHDGSLTRWATAGGWANGFFLGLSGGNIRALTPTGDHKVMVSATDPTPDYLDTKIESTSGNIAVTHISGPPEFVNLNFVAGGNTPQTMFWGWNMLTTNALNNQFMCEGGSNTGNETCNQYPVLQTFSSVTWSLNILNNSCTGGGTPTFTVRLEKNGSSVTSTTVSCGTTGVVSVGTTSFAASPGDVIGLVYDGTAFGTGGAGGVEAFVTARFDP